MNPNFSAPSRVWLILLKMILFFILIHLVLTATNSDLFYMEVQFILYCFLMGNNIQSDLNGLYIFQIPFSICKHPSFPTCLLQAAHMFCPKQQHPYEPILKRLIVLEIYGFLWNFKVSLMFHWDRKEWSSMKQMRIVCSTLRILPPCPSLLIDVFMGKFSF